MIWHIFRKDVKLMWRFAALVAMLQLAYAFLQLRTEFGRGNVMLEEMHTLLMFLWVIAAVVWVIQLVHQDALPGTKQDWLVRPIRRLDVMAAKLLFSALVVQGSSIAGDLLEGLGAGFPIGQCIKAAMARAVVGFIAITIPALVMGAVTQSIAEAMVLTASLGAAAFLFTLIAIGLAGGYQHQFDPTNGSGIEWIPNLVRFLLIFAGGLALMAMQYRSRKTSRARVAMMALLGIVLISQIIPWRPVFAVQSHLSSAPQDANGITMEWDANDKAMADKTTDRAEFGGIMLGGVNSSDEVALNLPITVTGLPAESILVDDNARVQLNDSQGATFFQGDGGNIRLQHDGPPNMPTEFAQAVRVPLNALKPKENQAGTVQARFSMTLFRLRATYRLSAIGGDQRMPGWGRCKSIINDSGTAVEMTCMQMGRGPTCATVFLEDSKDGSRNRMNTSCYPNYSAYIDRPVPDAASHFRLVLPFRDAQNSTKYPVDETKVHEANIVIRMYEPTSHFTRQLTSPQVKLAVLEAK
jgi:hypothetical protein